MELPEQDTPPEQIWLDPEALNDHFQRIKERHSNPDMELIDDAPLAQNELTKQFKQ